MAITVKEWYSKAELEEHARQTEPWSLVLGKDTEAPQKYYSISAELSKNNLFEICIVASGSGILPSMSTAPNGNILAVGYDDFVSLIDTSTGREVFKKQLDGVFYEFLVCPVDDQFIVLHELGLIRLDGVGNEVWSLTTGIIERWQLQSANVVVIKLLDVDEPLVVHLATGVARRGK